MDGEDAACDRDNFSIVEPACSSTVDESRLLELGLANGDLMEYVRSRRLDSSKVGLSRAQDKAG